MDELRTALSETAVTEAATQAVSEAESGEAVAPPALIEAEDLLEEISIDGMCGVY
ncbi:mycofactocin precursor MftA [Streptomyces sp. NPDC002755]|uniref:mycofactocin precursor MftA n=1 Tax=Streptomyces sp. NPDC002884 TaxID=3154544 RepID=UPI00332DCB10